MVLFNRNSFKVNKTISGFELFDIYLNVTISFSPIIGYMMPMINNAI